MKIKQLLVLPNLPDSIKNLQELAHNLWYSWNPELSGLFKDLDSKLWEETHHNPVELLSRLPQERLAEAAENEEFTNRLNKVYADFQSYIKKKFWFQHKYGEQTSSKVAYFSLEYGLDTGLPVYSGGLGILSGDTLKAASDLGVPMVAVGLLYRYGYFHQALSKEGWQQERYEENDWYHMPIQRVKGQNGNPLQISIDLAGEKVELQLWQVQVGRIPLYLLDANISDNSPALRDITSILYGGDKEMRIKQEIVLGVGGVRALKALKIDPQVYHINEGHAWFLVLERLRNLMESHQLNFDEAYQYIWATSVFTTHTPVPAGNEKFDSVLVHRYLADSIKEMGISWDEFLKIGRVIPEDETEPFNMTVAALKSSAFNNGVSELHCRTAREMWRQIWPNVPFEEIPIKAISNGVNPGSWISPELNELYKSTFGPDYVERPGAPEVWKKVYDIADSDLWRYRNSKREQLVEFVRKRQVQQLFSRGSSQTDQQRAKKVLDPRALTIGFARRFSSYKRGNLIFSDIERLEKIINQIDRPVQLIISGKAHPLDNSGKEIIKQIVKYAADERLRDRIMFLEDYDINIARILVQGVDVWLNNPRRPQEASGTSGMKAALNGCLHLSILDGWWAEAFDGSNGFAIGSGHEIESVEAQDRFDADMLYNCLEHEVVPMFYKLNEIGLPAEWIARMKNSIKTAGESFSSQRMLMNYTDKFYLKAFEASRKLSRNNFELTRSVSKWTDKMAEHWESIEIRTVDMNIPEGELFVGQTISVTIEVFLGEIDPEDVNIEIVAGRLASHEELTNFKPIQLSSNNSGKQAKDGTHSFKGEVTLSESGKFGISARVTPNNESLPHTIRPKMISWW